MRQAAPRAQPDLLHHISRNLGVPWQPGGITSHVHMPSGNQRVERVVLAELTPHDEPLIVSRVVRPLVIDIHGNPSSPPAKGVVKRQHGLKTCDRVPPCGTAA